MEQELANTLTTDRDWEALGRTAYLPDKQRGLSRRMFVQIAVSTLGFNVDKDFALVFPDGPPSRQGAKAAEYVIAVRLRRPSGCTVRGGGARQMDRWMEEAPR